MISRPSVLPLFVPLLFFAGTFPGDTSDPCALRTPAEMISHTRLEVSGALFTSLGLLRCESPGSDQPMRAALGDTVRVMVAPIVHFAIPDGPLDATVLTEAVAALLRAEPGIEVVAPGDGVHMVTSSVTQDADGRALIQVGLVRIADGIVVRRRGVDVTLSPEEAPLARRIADKVLRLIEEAGLRQ